MAAPALTVDRRGISVLASGHLCSDLCQSAVPALLPFLLREHGWSYSALAALVLAVTITSSLVQPVFGHLSDRFHLAWLLPTGVFVGGLGIALTGVAPGYPLTFAAVLLGGLGVAAFHPEAARFAAYVSGDRRATGWSYFSLGGNAGFTLGPVLVTPLVLLAGLPGTLALALLTTSVALVLAHELPRLKGFRPAREPGARPEIDSSRDRVGAFVRVSVAIALLSGGFYGLLSFAPLYFTRELGTSEAEANTALTAMLAAGAVGALAGGRLADRYGRARVLLIATAALPPLLAAALLVPPLPATLLLMPVGACIVGGFTAMMVLGQEYLPSRLGLASGITLGLAVGAGGVAAALLGLVADALGLPTVMWICAALPIPAIALAASLPPPAQSAVGLGSRLGLRAPAPPRAAPSGPAPR